MKRANKVLPRRGVFAPTFVAVTDEGLAVTPRELTVSNPDGPPIDTGAIHRASVAALYSGPHNPRYVAAFRAKMAGERCQCPGSCLGPGEQVHHEPGGIAKDDRSIVWLSRYCHHDIRELNLGWPGGGYAPVQFRAALRAAAADSWLAYLDSFA